MPFEFNPATITRLLKILDCCPCCSAGVFETFTADDGIPDGDLFEVHLQCGARIGVTEREEFRVSTGCPKPTEDELFEIEHEITTSPNGGEAS